MVLAQDAVQSESEGLCPVGGIPPDQRAVSVTATKTGNSLWETQVICCAVNQLLNSVVREIRTLRLCGSRKRATASGDLVGGLETRPYPISCFCPQHVF